VFVVSIIFLLFFSLRPLRSDRSYQQVGLRKPDPQIFALACKQLSVAPSACVFLDDIGANVQSARSLGMATIKVGREYVRAIRELGAATGLDLLAPQLTGHHRASL
jgi:beta-phosphoglucomutase-like phosphatase (HAD superfamily)